MDNKRLTAYLAATMAMGYTNEFDDAAGILKLKKNDKPEEPPKPCFRKSCENERTQGKLYCSAECCRLDKIERRRRCADVSANAEKEKK